MTKEREALKLALEALEKVHQDPKGWWNCHVEITAIQAALAQPEQTPEEKGYVPLSDDGKSVFIDGIGEVLLALAQPTIKQSLTVEQKPVAWTLTEELEKRQTTCKAYLWFSDPVNYMWTPLYTAPPKRQPLTDKQIFRVIGTMPKKEYTLVDFARAIEADHSIREAA